ncbi:DUF1668 domain-containing protein [Bacillus sp. CLL-7-23]|uniref:DUF1668 domain-containing protein n=1 Tax=Bacillus changyiensis TaxID=3004103 RepID=A0ABT4X2Z0_9BACI|nr:DUF1668 domain-containing protein [Bacillus changyiensis]MDA7026640.1 DUF1668 domain-containing protein [Bacillus changyiensis]
MKKTYIIAFIFLLFAGIPSLVPAKAEENNNTYKWVEKASLPEALFGTSTTVVDGKIYMIGGGKDDKVYNHTYVYDPKSDAWSQKSNMPTARKGAASAVVDGKIYIIGGHGGKGVGPSNKVEVYNPKNDTWETAPNLPQRQYAASAAVVGNNIYVIGGHAFETPSYLNNKNYCYDTNTKTWSEKKPAPINLEYLTTSVVDGKIYALGGFGSKTSVGNKTIYEYNPSSDTWDKKKDLLKSYMGSSSTTIDGKIFIIGGSYSSSNVYDTVQVYDPAKDTVEEFNKIQYARTFSAAVSIDKNIYVIGGTKVGGAWESNSGALNYVEMLSLESKTDTPPKSEKPTDQSQTDNKRAKLIVTMITGLEKEYDLPMKEVNEFINWYDQKDTGSGSSKHAINIYDKKGPYTSRKDYVIFKNILMFQVNEYNAD